MYTISKPQVLGGASLKAHLQQAYEPSLLSRFLKWADSQSEARFIWLGVILLAHASLLTPFTVMAVLLTGNSFPLVMAALGAMGLALVTNLAALPTKVTIPAFFLSILIDLVVVAIALLA